MPDNESLSQPSTPIRRKDAKEQSAAQSHLTTSAAASLASASSVPPPLLSRSSIKSSATQSKDQRGAPSLHIHLNESTQQIHLSPSPSRPRSVLSTGTDEGLDVSLVLDTAPRIEDEGLGIEATSSEDGSAVRTAFLARRLRSAIGDELLLQNEALIDAANRVSSLEVSEPNRPLNAVSNAAPKAEGVSASDQAEPSSSSGWGWSTLTTLPASLRVGTAMNSLKPPSRSSTDANSTGKGKPDLKHGGESSSIASDTPSFGSYMKPLDVRRWWGATSSSSRSNSSERPESSSRRNSIRDGDDNRSIRSIDSPNKSGGKKELNHPSRGVPSGSFPASSIAKRNKKKREQLPKEAKGKERAGEGGGEESKQDAIKEGKAVEGSDVIVHDLSEHLFGGRGDSGSLYSEREYLVLSTAGKPIYISHVSKARLKRAAETKARRQGRQESGENEDDEDTLAAKDTALQDEEDQNAATRVGVIQALISNYESLGYKELQQRSKDILELPSNSRISFVLKPPLYLAAISQWGEDEVTLCNHLEYLYYAIISIVSASKLNRLFDRAANFDLKRLLDGTDGILDSLLTGLQVEAAPLYDSLQPLRIEAGLRAEVGAALVPSKDQVRPRDALYALLVGPSGIVALAKRKRKSIHPVDCHLLINTVYATKAMKEAGTQSWVPICLPKFAPQGFLYAHVSFLREEPSNGGREDQDAGNVNGNQASDEVLQKAPSELALVLVTSNPDGFEELSLWQASIVETLRNQQTLVKLAKAMQVNNATYTADELRLPGLRHFIFKWRSNLQSTSPQFEEPYELNSDDQKRLICLYGIAQDYVYRRATSSSTASDGNPKAESVTQKTKEVEQEEQQSGGEVSTIVASPPSPIIRPKNILSPSIDTPKSNKKTMTSTLPLAPKKKPIIAGQHLIQTSSEIVFAWSTREFELYLAVGLHLPRNAIINIAKAIVKWVKQEEHRLFISSPSLFD